MVARRGLGTKGVFWNPNIPPFSHEPASCPCHGHPTVRVRFEDVERLPEILKRVPQREIKRLQTNIRKVWRR